jgi:hypothetical protein
MAPKTRDKWLSIIRRYERSSLTMERFAQSQSVNFWTFRPYYYELRQLLQDQRLARN